MRERPLQRIGITALLAILAASCASPTRFRVAASSSDPAAILASIRAWRSDGHPTGTAIIELPPGTIALRVPLALTEQDHDLVIQAISPGQTVLSGGTAIAGWRDRGDGCWIADLPAGIPPPEQLYADGQRLPRAREPDADFFTLGQVGEITNAPGDVEISLELPADAARLLPAERATIQVFHKWDTTRGYVVGFDATTRVARLHGEPMKPWNRIAPGRRFRIENVPGACDAPGEWYIDGRTIVLRGPPLGDVIAPRLEQLVDLRGSSNVAFRGIRFAHQAYVLPARGDAAAQAANFVEAAVQAENARGIVFEDCVVEQTGGYAMWFRRGCRDNVVRRCALTDLGAGGVRIGEMRISKEPGDATRHILVEDSLIQSIGRVHPSAVGIWIGQSPDNIVRRCEIADTFYSGFSVGWTWGYGPSLATNNLIEGNYVHQIGQGALCDLGGIYTLGVSPGTRITGNYFADIEAWEYGGWGLYTDEGSTGIELSGNVVVRTRCRTRPMGAGGFHQHYGATNLIVRNFFADASGAQIQASRVEDHLSFTLRDNTIVNIAAPAVGGTWNVAGPWEKIRAQSDGNRFYCGVTNGYAGQSLAEWRKRFSDETSRELRAPPATPPPPRLRAGPRW